MANLLLVSTGVTLLVVCTQIIPFSFHWNKSLVYYASFLFGVVA